MMRLAACALSLVLVLAAGCDQELGNPEGENTAAPTGAAVPAGPPPEFRDYIRAWIANCRQLGLPIWCPEGKPAPPATIPPEELQTMTSSTIAVCTDGVAGNDPVPC